MSYEAADPPLGRSEGEDQERVNELVCRFEVERLVTAFGPWVSGAGRVVKV